MIRVLVVSDSRLYREGLAHLLRAETALGVISTVAHGEEAIACARSGREAVVAVDMAMTETLEAVRTLAGYAPGSKIIVLGVPEAEEQVIPVLEAGASGYVTRSASVQDLVAIIRSVVSGETICSPRMAALLATRVSMLAAGGSSARPAMLTPREVAIGRLIRDGLTNKEIASRLEIELATVKNHVHNILEKLRVGRRADAAAWMRTARAERAVGWPRVED